MKKGNNVAAPRKNGKTGGGEPPVPSVNDIEKANKIKVAGRNPRQIAYLQSMKHNDLTVALGPAGTGKTYLATMRAAEEILRGTKERFIIVRPAVAAGGEEHGFLPGDLRKKLAPWARPVVDLLAKAIGHDRCEQMLKAGTVEAMPFTYMRGLTLDNAFIILDEAQNVTVEQMKLFTTRLGENVKVVICGDIAQTDMPGNSGLVVLADLIEDHGIPAGLIEFTSNDVERSVLAGQFVRAWEAYDACRAAA